MNIEILIIILLAVIAAILLFQRLSGKRYGVIRPSMEATNAYLAFRVDPAMSYYLSGSEVYPNGIIGVHPSWTLQSDLWKPVAMDSPSLKRYIENMKSLGLPSGVIPYGYEICDDGTGKIGNLFSLPGQNMTVWLREQNRFEISTPENLYAQK